MLAGGISTRRKLADRDFSLDAVQSRGDRVVIAFSWSDREGRRHHWAQVLRLKDGKIIDMHDYASPRSALALTRLRTVFG